MNDQKKTGQKEIEKVFITQEQVDNLLKINDLIANADKFGRSLIDELKDAILDSGTLEIDQWILLRKKLSEIEELIPHIDLIVKLKRERSGD